jgi:probable addiction module antidote protein
MDNETLQSIRSRTVLYDGAMFLETKKDMAAYLEVALEDGDPQTIATALGNIARAKGMGQIAKETGLNRESLYSALSPDGNPTLNTFLKVVHSLGLHLAARATKPAKARATV